MNLASPPQSKKSQVTQKNARRVHSVPLVDARPRRRLDDNTSSSTRQTAAPRKGSLGRRERKDLDLPPLLFGKLLAGLLQGGKEEEMSARRLLLQRQEGERCRPAIAIRRLRPAAVVRCHVSRVKPAITRAPLRKCEGRKTLREEAIKRTCCSHAAATHIGRVLRLRLRLCGRRRRCSFGVGRARRCQRIGQVVGLASDWVRAGCRSRAARWPGLTLYRRIGA